MRPSLHVPACLRLLLVAVVALAGFGADRALAQGDPPGRVARLNYAEGNVTFAPAGDNEWTDAELSRPLVVGDKLWTDKGVRAEVQAGSSVVRMDGRTQLTVLALDDQSTQLSVTQGSVYVRVRNLPEGENFEIDTPNLAYRAAYPGDYRVDVDAQRGVTRVTINSGTGAVYGEAGQALTLGGGQQIAFKGRALEKVNVQDQPPQDNFDRWAAERIRREEQSVAARYVPRDVVGYQLLDAAGEWRQDANWGPVWFPQGLAANWAPYRNGRWEWMDPWGWTWIDDAPWAFVTSHYGRWAQIGPRWAWVPGRMGLRPIYAPALVAFVGGGNAPLAVGGKPSVAWFPLAPGEAWQPPYRTSQLYVSNVNANMPPLKEGGYVFQRKPEALTAISQEDFHRGRPAKGGWLRVAANTLANAQVVAPPPMPERGKAALARTSTAPAPAPAPPPEIRQVTNSGPSLQEQIEAQKQAQLRAQQQQAQRDAEAQRQRAARLEQEQLQREQARGEAARREQEQKIAEQQRVAEKLRLAERARRAEQQKEAAQQQKLAEQQQKLAEQQQRIAQQKAERAERAEQQKAEQQRVAARRAEQAKHEVAAKHERELQARRGRDAKRLAAASAKKDEQARRTLHAQQVEQARRAAERDAQVLAQQRTQREAWQKQQQAVAEQFKRDQQAWEEEQRLKAQQRQRPDLRKAAPPEPEVWQRGIPVLTPGRTS